MRQQQRFFRSAGSAREAQQDTHQDRHSKAHASSLKQDKRDEIVS
jgi:hypothetical protein